MKFKYFALIIIPCVSLLISSMVLRADQLTWHTYSNKSVGITLNIPEGWTVKETPNWPQVSFATPRQKPIQSSSTTGGLHLQGGTIQVMKSVAPNSAIEQGAKGEAYSAQHYAKTETTIGGYKAYRVEELPEKGNGAAVPIYKRVSYYVATPQGYYGILIFAGSDGWSDFEALLSKVLKSLTFLK